VTSVVRAPLFSSSEKLTEIKWLLKKLLDSDSLKMNQAQVTPQTVVEQNRSLLRSLFKFRQESSLLSYVNNKNGTEKKYYTLAEILTVLKDTIRGEKLYDEKNPSIILCSDELENVLNMKALHVTEIRDLVLGHLIKIQDEAFLAKFRHHTSNQGSSDNVPISTVNTPAQRLIHTSNISTQVVTDKNAKFKVNQKFLDVLSVVPNFDKSRTVYTYEEVTLLLSTYILMNKKKFFDTRNIKLAMVQDDPLGEAFGVNAFHRCQVNNLLRGQLTPVTECPDTAVVTSTSSPGCEVSITEKPVPVTSVNGVSDIPENLRGSAAGMALPAFPALSKAQTMPSSGFVRKRSDSESDSEDLKASKLARTHRSKSVSDCDTETETETIESVQSKETIEANNDNDNENVSEEDDVQEYEPETGDEAERPPQAMGRNGDLSDFSDSDSDWLDENIIIDKEDVKRRRDEAKKDSVYWGDSEIDDKELSSYDSELEPADIWMCHTCNKPNKPYFRYCASCWKVRRGWLGYDGRKKKKSKKSGRKITSHDSDNETDGCTVEDRPRMDSQDSGVGTGDSQEFEIAQTEQKKVSKVLERSVSQVSQHSTESSSSSGYHSIQSKTSHLCLLCCTRPKDASLVHGRIGHQVCCYTCAKKLWRKRADCPVCRRKVERIIKIIPA